MRSPLPRGAVLGREGAEMGIVAQPREELDAGRAVPRPDQRPDDTPQGVATVADAQMRPGDDPGLFAEQRDGQFTLGAERLSAAGFPGLGRQLRAAEVEPPGT